MMYLGLILIVASWIAAAILLIILRDSKAPSISEHASSDPRAVVLFAIGLIGLAVGMYFWTVDWYAPHLELGTGFLTLMIIALGAQVMIGLIPDFIGWRRTAHRLAAYLFAIMLLPNRGRNLNLADIIVTRSSA